MERWVDVEQVASWLALYGLAVLGAVLILIFGLLATKLVTGALRRILTARDLEPTLVTFSCNLLNAALVVIVAIASLNKLGIQTTSLVAVLGAAGLAVGLALQGSLSNFAAGILILTFRPFKVGDVIEGAGVIGAVEDLQLFTTQLKTGDNKTVFIPNSRLTSDNIVNYSRKGTRRVDLVIGVGYGEDVRRVKKVLLEILEQDDRILADPAPEVAVLDLAESCVNFAVRPWVRMADYWTVYFDTLEKIKLRLDEEGIQIPYPQRDIHLFHEGKGNPEAA